MCLSTRSLRARHLQLGCRVVPALALLSLQPAGPAVAEPCKLARVAELPVTMEGMRPLVHAAINGQDALFVADSGAFYSSLTPAAARQFNLRLEPTNVRFNLVGVGGSAQTWITKVPEIHHLRHGCA